MLSLSLLLFLKDLNPIQLQFLLDRISALPTIRNTLFCVCGVFGGKVKNPSLGGGRR